MKFSNLTRIYNKQSLGVNQQIKLGGDDFHYLKSVMRMRVGQEFRIFNEQDGEYLASVVEVERRELVISVGELIRKVFTQKPLALAMCIIKPDRMLEAIKGAVQLGVTEIVPIISERVQQRQINREKIEKVIIQSVEQSERFLVPILKEVTELEEFIKASNYEQIIWASETADENNKISNIKEMKGEAVILIGPEGGFSEGENEKLGALEKVTPVSLGEGVLRAEVAAIIGVGFLSDVVSSLRRNS